MLWMWLQKVVKLSWTVFWFWCRNSVTNYVVFALISVRLAFDHLKNFLGAFFKRSAVIQLSIAMNSWSSAVNPAMRLIDFTSHGLLEQYSSKIESCRVGDFWSCSRWYSCSVSMMASQSGAWDAPGFTDQLSQLMSLALRSLPTTIVIWLFLVRVLMCSRFALSAVMVSFFLQEFEW